MSACCGQTNFTPFGILFDWMEPKPPKRRKFESPRKKIKNDNPREIQQMSRRNDSGFESLAETYGKRGQLYWKVSAEARLSAEGSWCHRPATISHFPTQGPTLPPLTPPIYLSTTLLFARSRDRSSILIRDSFASHDSSSIWRLLVENPINSSPRTQIPLDIIVDASSLQSDRSIIQFCGNSIISSIRVSLIVPIIADRIIIWIIWIERL